MPAEAVRAYLDELGEPRHDVQLDQARLRRLSVDAINALPDEELARAGRRAGRAGAGAPWRARPERGGGHGACDSRAAAGARWPSRRVRRWSGSPSCAHEWARRQGRSSAS